MIPITLRELIKNEYKRRLYIADIKRRLLRPNSFTNSGITIGINYDLFTNDIINHMLAGYYETDELSIIEKLLSPNDIVLEIGAGIGFTSSYIAKKLSPDGHIECFEANYNLIPLIKENHKRNGVTIGVQNAILAKKGVGVTEFFIHEGFWSSSIQGFEGGSTEHVEGKTVCVPNVDFQEYLGKYRPTMLVVDIEGSEIELFSNVKLDSVKKICIELHPRVTGPEKIAKMLKKLCDQGFQIDEQISLYNVKALMRN